MPDAIHLPSDLTLLSPDSYSENEEESDSKKIKTQINNLENILA